MLGFSTICKQKRSTHSPISLILELSRNKKRERRSVQMNNNIKIPGLEGVIIKKVEQFEERVAIYVELPVQTHKCSVCGEETRKVHDYRTQKIKHLKWFERLSYIFYRKRRYKCGECGKRFYEKNSIVERYKRFSKERNQAVNIRSVKTKTFKEMGQQYGASTSTIIRQFDEMGKKRTKRFPATPTCNR